MQSCSDDTEVRIEPCLKRDYPMCPLDVRESLAVQFFIDAISDEDTQLCTRLIDFTDLKSALAYSMKYEASKISMHARPIRIEDNSGKRKDEKIIGQTCCWEKKHPSKESERDLLECYKKGHVQRECPSDNASLQNPNATCWKYNKKRHLQNECQQFTSIYHHKETRHGKDKALSRRSFVESCELGLNSDKKFGTETDVSVRALRMTTEDTWSVSEIQKAQLEDPDIRPILEKKLKLAEQPSRQEITQKSPATKRY
ncbi:hypothetical protein AVEN_188711-1 [Araneus ventricosus]|uniref:Uncharacterized protein n=1 Tax=Araneus ventricosus TaxID=182803 RepID=A0A4Y2D8Y4_ARAVE|nr:hypothetical protein AVEN_188711-1 [Araneus ventricosus]